MLLATAGIVIADGRYSVFPNDVQLVGGARPVQLVVSQYLDRHFARTRDAKFRSSDENVVAVSEDGRVAAISNGTAQISVTVDDRELTTWFEAIHCDNTPTPDFATEIQPILAASGCSTGACHGKQGGQNGFQLSLLGFDDAMDFAAITRQGRGRRIFPSAPANSLLLRKATAAEPHGGGQRFDRGHPYYLTLHSWIAAGAPQSSGEPKRLTKIDVSPADLVLSTDAQHRLVVTATFSDGSRRDVTNMTAFSSNETGVAKIGAIESNACLVEAGPIAGEATIMARFMDEIATCDVLIPRGDVVPTEMYERLPVNNEIDKLVWKKLARLNILPSEPAPDARYLRRVYIDLIGRQPPTEVVQEFLADESPTKREQLVDRLLEHPGYADHWANKWVDLLRPNPYRVGIKAVISFDNWIRQAFRENRPYDQFVRDIITAQGSTWHNGASTLYRDRRSPDELTTIVSQLFLGVRLECAKCHHHPFEVWGQDDFYSFAAFFARVGRKGTGLSPPISGGEEIVFVADHGNVQHPRTKAILPPRTLGDSDPSVVAADQDPRLVLAQWMTSDDNPYFAKVIANRIWAELMGRGLVDPVDDLRATNPASNEALLEALAEHLRENDYNLKALIRFIATSQVYGLSSKPNETNGPDHRNYSRHYRQRLRAEVLLDAINEITGSTESFAAMPPGSRANEVWTHRIPSLFLDTFSRPDLNQDPPCERVKDTAVVQALHLMNSPKLHRKVTDDDGYARQLSESEKSPAEIANELYVRVYSRYPTDDEKKVCAEWFDKTESRQTAVEDLLWSMLNSAEFVFKD